VPPAPKTGSSHLAWILGGAAAGLVLILGMGLAVVWVVFLRPTGHPVQQAVNAQPPLADLVQPVNQRPNGNDPREPAPQAEEPAKKDQLGPPAQPEPAIARVAPAADVDSSAEQATAAGALRNLGALKAATVFVKVEAGAMQGSGSGFLLKIEGDTAFVVTNHHVANPQVEFDITELVPSSPAHRPSFPNRPSFPSAPNRPSFPSGVHRPPQLRIPSPPTTIRRRHVVVNSKNPNITLVFWSGTKKEQSGRAEIVATDPDRDLAILRIRGIQGLPQPIETGPIPGLIETTPVFVLGFPFGRLLTTNQTNPAITVGKGSVSSLREDEHGKLAIVQIDGALNPGNSGGPVVDGQGRLVGVAVATIKGAGIGLAIPSIQLTKMLQGRIGATAIKTKKVANGTAEMEVEAQLIDPMNRIRTVCIGYTSQGSASRS
jgi:S1-C subfamily serine protease